jgi:hypothetical protein
MLTAIIDRFYRKTIVDGMVVLPASEYQEVLNLLDKQQRALTLISKAKTASGYCKMVAVEALKEDKPDE